MLWDDAVWVLMQAHTAMQVQVEAVVSSVLGASVSPSRPLLEAGLDSVGAVELQNALSGVCRCPTHHRTE